MSTPLKTLFHSTCQRVGLVVTSARNIGEMPTVASHCVRVITCAFGLSLPGSTQAATSLHTVVHGKSQQGPNAPRYDIPVAVRNFKKLLFWISC